MSKQNIEQQLEDLYRELAKYTKQMDREGVSRTRTKIVQLERNMKQMSI
ncbi:hypothetical protein [Shimazuella kribbensis]|nr:hypothetical protein [Shimazuella kribbensis]